MRRFKTRESIQRYNRDWYHRNKGIVNPRRYRRQKKARARIKKLLRGIKAARGCLKCGFNIPAALQFHHRDHHDKKFNVSEALNRGYDIDTVLLEIAKCDVLCANCHAIETDENRHKWKHGKHDEPPADNAVVEEQMTLDGVWAKG